MAYLLMLLFVAGTAGINKDAFLAMGFPAYAAWGMAIANNLVIVLLPFLIRKALKLRIKKMGALDVAAGLLFLAVLAIQAFSVGMYSANRANSFGLVHLDPLAVVGFFASMDAVCACVLLYSGYERPREIKKHHRAKLKLVITKI